MTKQWTSWIGYLTAVACAVYVGLGLYWANGGAGFPFGVGDSEMIAQGDNAIHASLLGFATPEVAGPIIAVVGLAAGLVALALARGVRRGGAVWQLLGGIMAAGLLVGVQDYRPLILVAATPILVISKPLFNWAPDVSITEFYAWPRLHLLILLLLGIAWVLTIVAYRRETGRRGDVAWLRRLGRPATYLAVAAPLVYSATRWAWALGFSLGLDAEAYRQGQLDGTWLGGALLATMGAVGAVLTLGLIQRWGEVFPRWMLGLRGKRVPVMLAVVPATFVSVLVTAAGSMYVRVAIGMGVEGDDWVTIMPETLWPVWGVGLFVAALAYRQRRQAHDSLSSSPA